MENLGTGWRIPRPTLETPKSAGSLQVQEGHLSGFKNPLKAHPRNSSPEQEKIFSRKSFVSEKKEKKTEKSDKKKNKENWEKKSKKKKIFSANKNSMDMIEELKSTIKKNIDGDIDNIAI